MIRRAPTMQAATCENCNTSENVITLEIEGSVSSYRSVFRLCRTCIDGELMPAIKNEKAEKPVTEAIAVINDQWGTSGRIHAADPETAETPEHDPGTPRYRSRCGLRHTFGSTKGGRFTRKPAAFADAPYALRCARCERSVGIGS